MRSGTDASQTGTRPWVAGSGRGAACIVLSASLATSLAAAQTPSPNDYDTCIALVEENPGRAESEAANWAEFGGGAPARHCRAMALLALGADRRAAEELTRLGIGAPELPADTRAEILEQAAQAYLDIGEIDLGLQAIDRSLRLAVRPTALTRRAELHAANEAWALALSDLDLVIDRAGPTPDRLLLRASARRREGRLVEARADVNWALELEPDLPIAYLELGEIEASAGETDLARSAYLTAIGLDPGGDVAASARLALYRLEEGG